MLNRLIKWIFRRHRKVRSIVGVIDEPNISHLPSLNHLHSIDNICVCVQDVWVLLLIPACLKLTDSGLRNIIDKLAEFVARNGQEFENITKAKQQGNPRFSFLFGGDYNHYYVWRVQAEQASKLNGLVVVLMCFWKTSVFCGLKCTKKKHIIAPKIPLPTIDSFRMKN